jgi:hypothetical protein
MTKQEQALEIERLQKQINAMADRIAVLKKVGSDLYRGWGHLAADQGYWREAQILADQPEDFVSLG